MPSQSSSTTSRGRRPKDKEVRAESHSTSRRRSIRKERDRSRDRSEYRSEYRSPPPLPALKIYSQHNLTLDSLPALPDSVTTTPTSSSLILDGSGEETPRAEPRLNPLQYLQPSVEDWDSEAESKQAYSIPVSPKSSTVNTVQKEEKEHHTTSERRKEKELQSEPRVSHHRRRSSVSPALQPKSPPPPVSLQQEPALAPAPAQAPAPTTPPTATHQLAGEHPALATPSSQVSTGSPPQYPAEFAQVSNTPPVSPTFQPYGFHPLYYTTSPSQTYLPVMIPPNGVPTAPSEAPSMPPPLSPPYSGHRSPAMDQLRSPTIEQISSPLVDHMPSMPMHHYQPTPNRSSPYSYGEPIYGIPSYQHPMERPAMSNYGRRTSMHDGMSIRSMDDPEMLLRRVQEVLPDLSILVNRYRETHGQLFSRESESRHNEEQHLTALAQKEFYLQALKDQIKEITLSQEKEKAALNLEKENLKREISERLLEVGDLQERVKSLEEGNTKLEQQKKELAALNESLETERNGLLEVKQKAESERENLEKKVVDLEALAQKLNGDYKSHTDDLERQLQERDRARMAISEQERADLSARHEKHVNDIMALHARERDEAVDKVRREQESIYAPKIKELEDTIAKHPAELEALRRSHEEDCDDIRKGFEQDRGEVAARNKAELEKHTSECSEKLKHRDLEFEKARETWTQSHDAVRTHLERNNEELVASAGRLSLEVDKMKRILDALGEATVMKSKGDSFFVHAFGDLSRQIVDLSVEHFQLLPIEPPNEILMKIPPGIPNFLDNTQASRDLRAAYVQHLVSNILTYRIFQPFLFTLGRRFSKADTLFQKMADDMRAKSTRREAVWRQQTLRAVYTASDAKQSANVIAAVIVDEIVEQIKHFSDPKNMSAIVTAVRGIVKVAAETWRYARLERELVTAIMPSAEDVHAEPVDWPEEEYHGYAEGILSQKGSEHHLLLRLMPYVSREAIHEDYPVDDDKHSAGPCVYLPGKALYSDSPPVIARKQELLQRTADPSGQPQTAIYAGAVPASPAAVDNQPPSPPPAASEVGTAVAEAPAEASEGQAMEADAQEPSTNADPPEEVVEAPVETEAEDLSREVEATEAPFETDVEAAPEEAPVEVHEEVPTVEEAQEPLADAEAQEPSTDPEAQEPSGEVREDPPAEGGTEDSATGEVSQEPPTENVTQEPPAEDSPADPFADGNAPGSFAEEEHLAESTSDISASTAAPPASEPAPSESSSHADPDTEVHHSETTEKPQSEAGQDNGDGENDNNNDEDAKSDTTAVPPQRTEETASANGEAADVGADGDAEAEPDTSSDAASTITTSSDWETANH